MRKTVFDRSALMFIGGVCLLAVLVSSFRVFRSLTANCPDIKIIVSAPNVIENTPFTVSCISPGVNKWDWDFGDYSPHANTPKVTHTYRAAGKYNLKLVVNGNQKCNSTLLLTVGQDVSATATADSNNITASIDGPTTAVVGHAVKYHETSGKATSWAWTSSDSKGIDATGQDATYTFTTAGKKTIYVTVNGNKSKASIDVNVVVPSGGGGPAKPKITEDAFRNMLKDVVNKKADVPSFNNILCNLKMVVNYKLGKDKPAQKTFDDFCKDIKGHGYRTEFDQIKLTFDPKGCVSGIDILMHKGSSRLLMDR